MTSQRHIAFVLTSMADSHGGPVTIAKDVGRRMSKLGVDVSYWAPGNENDRRECAALPGAHLFDRSWPRAWQYSRGLGQTFHQAVRGCDLVQVLELWTYHTYMVNAAAREAGKPYVLQVQGSLEPWRMRNTLWKSMKKFAYLNAIARRLMRESACVHAASEQEVESYRKAGYSGPVSIIPNGVDVDAFTPGPPDEAYARWPELNGRPYALFLSRLSLEKGLDKLIPAWKRFMGGQPAGEPLLIIAGPDDRGYASQVEAMIAGSGESGSIRMVGMVQGALKTALYCGAQCFILPTYNENYGIVVGEAMAAGTPAITTTNAPWSELNERQAGWWIEQTEENIYRALCAAFELSKSERDAMGLRGRESILERHSLDAVARKFITLNECVIEGRSIPLYPEPAQGLPI